MEHAFLDLRNRHNQIGGSFQYDSHSFHLMPGIQHDSENVRLFLGDANPKHPGIFLVHHCFEKTALLLEAAEPSLIPLMGDHGRHGTTVTEATSF